MTKNVAVGSSITLDATNMEFKNTNNKTITPDWTKVVWKFVPAYNNDKESTIYEISPDATVSNANSQDHFAIALNQKFLEFISIIFGDETLSQYNSKISFGIIPLNKDDETYTNVNVTINQINGRDLNEPISNINILGIKQDSNRIKLYDNNNNDIANKLVDVPIVPLDNNKDEHEIEIPIIINESTRLEYNIDVGDRLKVKVNNNVLINSYNLLNQLLDINNKVINDEFVFVIKDVNADAFGTRIYMDQTIANTIIGLDQISIISSLNNNTVTRIKPDYTPFNGVFSNDSNQEIGSNLIPFYSATGIWSFTNWVSQLNIVDINQTADLFVTENPQILKVVAKKLNIDTTLPLSEIRSQIVTYVANNMSADKFKEILNNVQGSTSMTVSFTSMLPKTISNELFNIMSSFFSTIIYILIAIIIPLLLMIIFISSFSIVEDFFKRISLLKIMGMNNKEIAKTIITMYLPIFITIAIIGIGLIFAAVYILQYLIFSITSIYISSNISGILLTLAFVAIIIIFSGSIVFMMSKLKKKEIASAVKF